MPLHRSYMGDSTSEPLHRSFYFNKLSIALIVRIAMIARTPVLGPPVLGLPARNSLNFMTILDFLNFYGIPA